MRKRALLGIGLCMALVGLGAGIVRGEEPDEGEDAVVQEVGGGPIHALEAARRAEGRGDGGGGGGDARNRRTPPSPIADVLVPAPATDQVDLDASRIPPPPDALRGRLTARPLGVGTVRSPGGRPGELPMPPRRKRPMIRPEDPIAAALFPRQSRSGYVGDVDCLGCHSDKQYGERTSIWGLIEQNAGISPPERRGCEGCHGPGGDHENNPRMITNPAKLDPRRQAKICLSCHADQRRVRRLGWHLSEHSEAHVRCTDCHKVHGRHLAKSLRAPLNQLCLRCHPDQAPTFHFLSKHPVQVERVGPLRSLRSGKMACVDCHQVYTSRQPLMVRDDNKALCVRCHQERAGPFLFEHLATDPIASDGCLTCHEAHGSPNRQLLKVTSRGLCQTCHTDRQDHFPGLNCYTAACHRDIHGSNSNRLFFPD